MNAPRTAQQMLGAELQDIADSLDVAIGNIIEAHTAEDIQSFAEALRLVNSARTCLRFEAAKLVEVAS